METSLQATVLRGSRLRRRLPEPARERMGAPPVPLGQNVCQRFRCQHVRQKRAYYQTRVWYKYTVGVLYKVGWIASKEGLGGVHLRVRSASSMSALTVGETWRSTVTAEIHIGRISQS